jgi:hypothetical protein
MEPGCVQVSLPTDQRSKGQAITQRHATWLCIPFFSLQKYAGPLSTAETATFPTQTLLQAQYSGVSRDRDLHQVVCQTGLTPPEMCFYIAQFWCIILGNCQYSLSLKCLVLHTDKLTW